MVNEDSLNDNEYDIYQFLQSTDTSNMTAKEVADRFYVTRSMVYRVVKKMGYKTFSAYKYTHNMPDNDQGRSFAINVEHFYTDISLAQLRPLVDIIRHSEQIYLYATQATCVASVYFCRELVNLGYRGISIPDNQEFSMRKKTFRTGDVVLVLSNSGENLAINPEIKDLDIPVLAVTQRNTTTQTLANYAITYTLNDFRYENLFERENLFPMFVVLQRLLMALKDSKLK